MKEREDAVRELSRLQDHMVEAHDNIIMALQVLAEENTTLRDRVNGVRQSTHARSALHSVCTLIVKNTRLPPLDIRVDRSV